MVSIGIITWSGHEGEPIYYINHFSRLKRPAIYSKYEYWGSYLLSLVLIALFFALWSVTRY